MILFYYVYEYYCQYWLGRPLLWPQRWGMPRETDAIATLLFLLQFLPTFPFLPQLSLRAPDIFSLYVQSSKLDPGCSKSSILKVPNRSVLGAPPWTSPLLNPVLITLSLLCFILESLKPGSPMTANKIKLFRDRLWPTMKNTVGSICSQIDIVP